MGFTRSFGWHSKAPMLLFSPLLFSAPITFSVHVGNIFSLQNITFIVIFKLQTLTLAQPPPRPALLAQNCHIPMPPQPLHKPSWMASINAIIHQSDGLHDIDKAPSPRPWRCHWSHSRWLPSLLLHVLQLHWVIRSSVRVGVCHHVFVLDFHFWKG